MIQCRKLTKNVVNERFRYNLSAPRLYKLVTLLSSEF